MLRGALARGRADLSSYDVELIGASELHRVRDAWADLFDRSAECNVFYGPDLLAPLANSPLCDSSFRALIVWRLSTGSRTLAGFMPLRMPVSPLSAVRGFKHHYIVGCAPLIDEANPVNIAIAMMDGLAALRRARFSSWTICGWTGPRGGRSRRRRMRRAACSRSRISFTALA